MTRRIIRISNPVYRDISISIGFSVFAEKKKSSISPRAEQEGATSPFLSPLDDDDDEDAEGTSQAVL